MAQSIRGLSASKAGAQHECASRQNGSAASTRGCGAVGVQCCERARLRACSPGWTQCCVCQAASMQRWMRPRLHVCKAVCKAARVHPCTYAVLRVQGCRYAILHVCRDASVQCCMYAMLHASEAAKVQCWMCASPQVCKAVCKGASVQPHRHTGLESCSAVHPNPTSGQVSLLRLFLSSAGDERPLHYLYGGCAAREIRSAPPAPRPPLFPSSIPLTHTKAAIPSLLGCPALKIILKRNKSSPLPTHPMG